MKKEQEKDIITITFIGTAMDDGRTYVTSPDLRGFHYLLERDEDPEVMMPTITEFLGLYTKAEIRKVQRADSLREFMRRRVAYPRERRPREYTLLAEVA